MAHSGYRVCMGVLPLVVGAKPCLCQMALGMLKMGAAAFLGAERSCHEAPIRREGEMVGVVGPSHACQHCYFLIITDKTIKMR